MLPAHVPNLVALGGDWLYWFDRIMLVVLAPIVAIIIRKVRLSPGMDERAPNIRILLGWLEAVFWGMALYSAMLMFWFIKGRPLTWLWSFGYVLLARVLPMLGLTVSMALIVFGEEAGTWTGRMWIAMLVMLGLAVCALSLGLMIDVPVANSVPVREDIETMF